MAKKMTKEERLALIKERVRLREEAELKEVEEESKGEFEKEFGPPKTKGTPEVYEGDL